MDNNNVTKNIFKKSINLWFINERINDFLICFNVYGCFKKIN